MLWLGRIPEGVMILIFHSFRKETSTGPLSIIFPIRAGNCILLHLCQTTSRSKLLLNVQRYLLWVCPEIKIPIQIRNTIMPVGVVSRRRTWDRQRDAGRWEKQWASQLFDHTGWENLSGAWVWEIHFTGGISPVLRWWMKTVINERMMKGYCVQWESNPCHIEFNCSSDGNDVVYH